MPRKNTKGALPEGAPLSDVPEPMGPDEPITEDPAAEPEPVTIHRVGSPHGIPQAIWCLPQRTWYHLDAEGRPCWHGKPPHLEYDDEGTLIDPNAPPETDEE